jgi:hypothetical protein
VADALSVTRTVKPEVPVEAGVPVIAPAELSSRPEGSSPKESVHKYGAVPPVAANS